MGDGLLQRDRLASQGRGDHRACAIGGVATIGSVKLNDQEQIDVAAAAPGPACDPITLEIVRGALRATQSEMEALIERTAMSPFIREKKDFYAALFDGEGRLIVGSNLPIFGDAIGPIREHYPSATMREGDIYWYNDCYASRGASSWCTPADFFIIELTARTTRRILR